MRRPGPDHRKADSLESLRKVQHQGHRTSIFCFCSSFKSLHFHQYFPHCALSSSISPVASVPINAILLLSLRHFWCSQGFPPTTQRRHERNRPLSRNIFRNQEEHRRASLLRPFTTLFHLLQELDNFSSRFVCQVQRNCWVESVTSHSCFFALYNLDALSKSPSSNLGNASSHSFNSSFLHGLFLHIRHFLITLPMLSFF